MQCNVLRGVEFSKQTSLPYLIDQSRLQAWIMTKRCLVGGWDTNHQQRVNGKTVITNPGTVFTLPDETRQEDLFRTWIRFCNRKDRFMVTYNNDVCVRHFEENLIPYGTRNTLIWALNPVPTIHAVKKSSLGFTLTNLPPQTTNWSFVTTRVQGFQAGRRNQKFRRNFWFYISRWVS